ncbi:MAG: hypothetical protein ACRC7C_10915, partial [Beijerinckiaceae bacterium]
MASPIVRRVYDSLPAPLRSAVKDLAKPHVDRIRATRMMLAMVRKTARLENVAASVSGVSPVPDDVALVRRLLAAYVRAVEEGHQTGASMWTEFFEAMHGDVHRIFLSGDVAAATRVLRDPGTTNLFYGFDGLAANLLPLAVSARWRNATALSVADSVVRLAEATGARRYPYHEAYSGGYGRPLPADPETCLAAVEAVLGCDLPTPNPFPGEHGLRLRRGVMSYRAA